MKRNGDPNKKKK